MTCAHSLPFTHLPRHPLTPSPTHPVTHSPRNKWTWWESNPPHRPCKGQSPPTACRPILVERSVRELNPALLLTTEVCCRNTYRPSSDPGWNRTITFLDVTQASSPLDHGITSVTEAGVEPAKSRGSRPRRFASLRTRSFSNGGSGGRTRRARLMRPR